MQCEAARDSMVLLHYGELDEHMALDLERHLRNCAACQEELATTCSLLEVADGLPMLEPSPTFLTQSRMQLDEALDALGGHGPLDRARSGFYRWISTLQSAPALATLLVGVGFLGGTALNRYQTAHAPKLPNAVVLVDHTHGVIANVSGIVQTPDSELVQVKYNRVVPESVEGSLDDPQIRQLLLIGMKAGTTNDVRTDSVALLASECRAGHRCGGGGNDEDASRLRGALMVTLRYDKNPSVRLEAIGGLQRYVDQDQRVRDAMLEALMHDPSAPVRKRAIAVLAPVQSDSSVRQVLRTVSTQDESPFIRNASFEALQSADGIQ